jgi:hypothetical protein
MPRLKNGDKAKFESFTSIIAQTRRTHLQLLILLSGKLQIQREKVALTSGEYISVQHFQKADEN